MGNGQVSERAWTKRLIIDRVHDQPEVPQIINAGTNDGTVDDEKSNDKINYPLYAIKNDNRIVYDDMDKILGVTPTTTTSQQPPHPTATSKLTLTGAKHLYCSEDTPSL